MLDAMEPIEVNGTPGILHPAATAATGSLALCHGASSNMNSPLLVTISDAMAKLGVHVVRYNLPFRTQRASGPPRPGNAEQDREGIVAMCSHLRDRFHLPVFAGGHSYGGRQTTMAAAEHPDVVEALLLFSYPLHPPRNREQRRTAHFPNLRTRAFFVHGSRDPFGLSDEMQTALQLIPASTRLELIAGKGHDLTGLDASQVAARFVDWIRA